NDTALFSMNPDLIVSATISGGAQVPLTKAGGGTLLLSGTNTYQGATRLTAGEVDIGNDKAFGNTSLLAISGGFLRAVDANDNPAARSIPSTVPISLDGNFSIYGSGNLTFGGQATLTGTRTIVNFDPTQVTTFAGIDENLFPGSGLTKQGRGELDIPGAATFPGALTIGGTNSVDGGTVRFTGAAGALFKNFSTINVGTAASLILDNTLANNNDRLPDATQINLSGGALRLI